MHNRDVLTRYDAFLVDIDGVLVRGETVIPGAVEALGRLRDRGRTVLLSNNSSRSRRALAERLEMFGFSVTAEDLVPSSDVAARYLASEHGVSRFWLIGERGLREELLLAGHRACSRPEEAQWLVVGIDRTLTYATLTGALRALRAGARLLATNTDPTFPGSDELLPGAGAIVGALRGMGYSPEVIVGKPSPIAFEGAIKRLAVPRKRILMIGDRLETDILGGSNAGLDTALVLTGVTPRTSVSGEDKHPTWVSESLADLSNGRFLPKTS
jgi:HAD superfamily hydrolase (TIGR01457 family)